MYLAILKRFFCINSFFSQSAKTIQQMKKHLEKDIGLHYSLIDIIDIEDGVIYKDSTPIEQIPKPMQVMVGNQHRQVPVNCVANKPDMITEDEMEPTAEMSCGHAISKINVRSHYIFNDFIVLCIVVLFHFLISFY